MDLNATHNTLTEMIRTRLISSKMQIMTQTQLMAAMIQSYWIFKNADHDSNPSYGGLLIGLFKNQQDAYS